MPNDLKHLLLAVGAIVLLACNPLQQSHIAGNVPDATSFDQDLQRDLRAYFKGAEVKVELLRRAPTQSGVAYPKFYAWVATTTPGAASVEGVVRIAAVDRKKFEVTHFLTVQEIRADPGQLNAIFPASLCPVIKRRAGVGGI